MTPETGVRLGRYRLVERIGSGGMAEVYRATTEGAQGFVREVCIKRILPVFAGETDFVRMFVHEAQITARLQHANIATVFDFAEHDGVHFLVMELVDGPDLRRLLTALTALREPMPLDVALYVTRGMLEALHHAHGRTDTDGRSLDLVHRDISPHNVLVSYAGEVKLTDFGIAKARTLGLRTRTGQIKGKLAYMAPEQALGRALDARTDLWAVGVVLFEMLAGERPFQASTDVELSAAIMTGRSLPLSRFRPDVPEPITSVVGSLLTVDPTRRVQSAALAINALQQAMRDAAIAPASSLELAALVARAVPRTSRAPSLPPPRDRTELLPNAPQRSAAPAFRVAGPSDPTGTHGARVDPYDVTAAGLNLGVRLSVEPLRGSLTSVDPRPLGSSPPPRSGAPDDTAPARPGAVVAMQPATTAPATNSSDARPPAAPSAPQVAPSTPAPTLAAVIPPAAFIAPANTPSMGPMRPSDRPRSAAGESVRVAGSVDAAGSADRAPESAWSAGGNAGPQRRGSWVAGAAPSPSRRPPPATAGRVPLTRRPACLALAFLGFLLIGLLGGATAWYLLRGRRVRRAPRPAVATSVELDRRFARPQPTRWRVVVASARGAAPV
ncbi:MAG: protein kinase [Deltaproteobacteria bacterium]|nr:protein kinase [Deltaproteobacteria bacterium]